MSDPLEELLGETSARKRTVARPASGIVPRVRLAPWSAAEGSESASPTLAGAEADPQHAMDLAHDNPAGPHAGALSGKSLSAPDHPSPPGAPTQSVGRLPQGARVDRGRENAIVPPQKAAQLVAFDLHKSYRKGPVEVPVLRGVNLTVRQGEFLAIIGQSGSGKSTLLHLLGTLDVPERGEIHFEGQRIDRLSTAGRDALRNQRFGMIFQFYHLLPELTMLENVLAPLMITHGAWSYFRNRRKMQKMAVELLEMLGLGHRLKHRPRELSGGEMQRAAIARSLITRPCLLLADEPTGNLDGENGQEIIKILRALNRQQSLTIVMVTHDQAIAAQADRTIRLVDGRVADAA